VPGSGLLVLLRDRFELPLPGVDFEIPVGVSQLDLPGPLEGQVLARRQVLLFLLFHILPCGQIDCPVGMEGQ